MHSKSNRYYELMAYLVEKIHSHPLPKTEFSVNCKVCELSDLLQDPHFQSCDLGIS